MTEKISIETARRMLLGAQGLDHAPDRLAVKADVLATVRRMHVLQIDTIHVVARSPYLVLWSRLGDYQPEWLEELLAEGALFEYWSHAACFLPIEDYPFYRRRMLDAIAGKTWPVKWAARFVQEHPELIERVRTRIQEQGAVRSIEFENKNHQAGGWWNWKEEKDALEAMLLTGQIMVARRQNFQRVYDLSERVLPGWNDFDLPSDEELRRTLALRSVKALGLALQSWVADYFRQPKTGLPRLLEALAADGLLIKVEVEGLKGPAYIHRDRLGQLEEAALEENAPTLTTLLSPFDPVVWDRQRARELFNFDYQIECYTPAPKRRYGYFTLPILHRGRLVGRLDPKAHRAQKVFEVKALHLEPGVAADDELLVTDLAAALRRLAAWHATPELVIRQSDPPEFASRLSRAAESWAPGRQVESDLS